jgi:hypothetical protein
VAEERIFEVSATPEQIAEAEERAKALLPAIMALIEHGVPTDIQELLLGGNPQIGVRRGALRAAIERAQAERVRVLERLAERIAGEAPFKEPSGGPSVAWPPNWSEDMRDTVTDMIQEAFDEGRSCAYWHLGQIADAALKAAP